jgi:hypothetical protein
VVNRHQQTIRFYQPVKDILKNVLGVSRISHAPADEGAQPGAFPLHHFGYPLVLFECHVIYACHDIPLPV